MKSLILLKPYLVEKRFFILVGVLCLIAVDFLLLFIPRVIKWAVDDLTALGANKTRLLVYAGQLIAKGVEAEAACSMTMVTPLTDDPDMRDTLNAAVQTFFG